MPLLTSLEIYYDTIPRSAAMNMALDEILWRSATMPRLRLYEWDHPALSFGYFGRYTDVAAYQSEREVVRRCTGGGVVFHGSDLTYALIIPANDQRRQASPLTIYASVHQAIQTALRTLGIAAKLVPDGDCRRIALRNASLASKNDLLGVAPSATTTACFANPVTYDVMVDGRKVAGAAQRRSRRGLLQQGSIQNVSLSEKFRERFIAELGQNAVVSAIDSALLDESRRLADAKYATDEWLRRV